MADPERNLLTQNTVPMTIFAQDPSVSDGGPLLAPVEVPAGRLQRGPRSHRFHVVDIGVGTNKVGDPVRLHADSPWDYRDHWAVPNLTTSDLVDDPKFRAQNVFAVASYTLALFEQHLGRPIPWYSQYPHLYLIPQARVEANAFYSREHNAVLFGWLPSIGGRPPVYTTLSYDVISHEVSHAILDGLRPRYTEPGLPDQLAFHEALADLVALLSVFTLDGVAARLLAPSKSKVRFPSDRDAMAIEDEAQRREQLWRGRAETLKQTPLLSLAEEIGARRRPTHSPEGTITGRYPALRRSVELPPNTDWISDPRFQEAHRRAEVLVAMFLQTLVRMWAQRLEPLRSDSSGMDVDRVAEEGVTSARHLLGMILRALDYLPPVELEFADVLDSVHTADRRLAPDDQHNYRDSLLESFAAFGITLPEHRIVDEDGVSAPEPVPTEVAPDDEYAIDPDASDLKSIRYEHLNLVALRSSPEEVYQFIWNNSAALGIDVRLSTRVTRVLSSSRIGADGTLVTEVLADYLQTVRTTAANLPPGVTAPDDMPDDAVVELLGGGVLVFDQFGRFRLHQRKPILDGQRQTRRLAYLFTHGIRDAQGRYGTSDGAGDTRRFSLLHSDTSEDSW
ncbi:hypothetical protein AAFP30_15815 [Gordonia sp. CPCC 205515]|uniref:hypothetical protein n=1 Tax=Gordonia sp. CPCC 205515 TaxID=3140791 RepID=UPI003AF3ACE3